MEILDIDQEALADVTMDITADEAERMRSWFRDAGARLEGEPLDSGVVMAEAHNAVRALPERVVRALSGFRATGNPFGTLLLRNVPVDEDVPPTPADGYLSDWGLMPVATLVQLAVATCLGDVIAYREEKRGGLVQDIVPVRGAEERQENSGSVLLELHTENGFHPFKPDFVTMLCVRPDHARTARTTTVAISRVLPHLSVGCVEVLRQPLFRIRYSSSFTADGTSGYSAPLAVLSGPESDPELVADFHAMEPVTPAAVAALDELRTALLGRLTGTVLDRGALLVVDNRTTLHGRTRFEPRYDGRDRWLRRCFTVVDLRRSRGARPAGSRVVAPARELNGRLS